MTRNEGSKRLTSKQDISHVNHPASGWEGLRGKKALLSLRPCPALPHYSLSDVRAPIEFTQSALCRRIAPGLLPANLRHCCDSQVIQHAEQCLAYVWCVVRASRCDHRSCKSQCLAGSAMDGRVKCSHIRPPCLALSSSLNQGSPISGSSTVRPLP